MTPFHMPFKSLYVLDLRQIDFREYSHGSKKETGAHSEK